MNILTLYNAIRDGVADDSATKTWSQTNYSRDHKVFAGIDDSDPPAASDTPYVYLFMDDKRVGYDLTVKDHTIGAVAEIYKEGTTPVDGKSNIIALTGVIHNEEFRKLVETAIVTAVGSVLDEITVREISIAYEDSEPYPWFRSFMEVRINQDYYQGTDVFE